MKDEIRKYKKNNALGKNAKTRPEHFRTRRRSHVDGLVLRTLKKRCEFLAALLPYSIFNQMASEKFEIHEVF